MKLIDKDALIAEIERLRKGDGNPYFPSETADKYYERGVHFVCDGLVKFLDTLETKDVDLEKEIETHLKECLDVKFPTTNIEVIKKDVEYTARMFFELGLQAAQKGE